MNDGFVTGAAIMNPRPPWGRGYLIAAAAVLAVLLGLAWWVNLQRDAADHARAVVRESYQRRITAGEALVWLNEAESAQRGYVITGNPAFLAPYRPARLALDGGVGELARLYADVPDQAARVAELRGLIAAKFAEMDQVLRLRDTAGGDAATRRVADGQGRRLMERAHALNATLIASEERLLTGKIAEANRALAAVRYFLWGFLALAGAVALTALAIVWRNRRERYRIGTDMRDALVRLRAVFAATTDAVVILNPSGTIEDLNATATRLLGYRAADLARRDVSTLLPFADGEGSFEQRIGLIDGRLSQPLRIDHTARHRDGHAVAVDVALGLLPLADGLHVVASLRDVSERKAAERLKDEFISTVSHELRTPLSSVLGSLGLLRGGAAGVLSGGAQRLVDIADNNAKRLIRLINDILDIDRLGTGKITLDLAPVDLKTIAARAIEDARGLAEARGVRFVCDAPSPVLVTGDVERLLQVTGNLLSNAVRFSPDGGEVRLAVGVDGQKARLCIDDSGPGVPPEFRARLFERFSQSAEGAAIPGGSGLGLTISRGIVRAHEGDIWFEEAPGGGARFCVTLPLRAAPAVSAGTRPRVLVCEDDAGSAEVLRQMIEDAGYEVTICATAREAQALAQSGDYAGVVLDLHLPDASGLTAVRALRATPNTRAVPVIVVSGLARDGESDPAARALDVVDWLDKPVDHERLLGALGVAIERSTGSKPTLLHVDDDPDMLEVTALALADKGRMLKAATLADARAVLAGQTPDIVILDLNLPDGSGLELLPELFAADGAAVPTIIYSASELSPEIGRQFDAVLVKSRRSLLALSDTIGRVLDERRGAKAKDAKAPDHIV